MKPLPEVNNRKQARYVLPESTALAVIGGLDLCYTVYLLATGAAHEGNPLFDWLLEEYGPLGFVVGKAPMLAVPLAVAELARKKNEPFVRSALRLCIVLYLFIYLFSILR